MYQVIASIFGYYTPLSTIETYVDPVTEEVISYSRYVDGLAGVDWMWIAGVLTFTVVLVSFFKIVGAVIKRI